MREVDTVRSFFCESVPGVMVVEVVTEGFKGAPKKVRLQIPGLAPPLTLTWDQFEALSQDLHDVVYKMTGPEVAHYKR